MIKRPAKESLGTIQRVVEIIRFFAERGEASLKELSTALLLAPSTCHRLLDLLGREGLIERDSTGRRYRVGRELFRIGALLKSKLDVRTLAVPFLQRVVDVCNETCVLSLYLPSEGKIFFAAKIDSSKLLRYQLPLDTPISALWGASGRSIVAHLEPDEIDRIFRAEGRAPASGEQLPSRKTLERDLVTVRKRGYDITRGQKIGGAVGIASPVFDSLGGVIGSICITVPDTRVSPKDFPVFGQLVRDAATDLSRALGAPEREAARERA